MKTLILSVLTLAALFTNAHCAAPSCNPSRASLMTGNQSLDIILSQDDANLFVRCLGDMCVRNATVVHAWCLMGNYYQLCWKSRKVIEIAQGLCCLYGFEA